MTILGPEDMEKYKYLVGHGTLSGCVRFVAYAGVCLFLVICLDFITSGGNTDIPVRAMYTDVVDRAISQNTPNANSDISKEEIPQSPKLKELKDTMPESPNNKDANSEEVDTEKVVDSDSETEGKQKMESSLKTNSSSKSSNLALNLSDNAHNRDKAVSSETNDMEDTGTTELIATTIITTTTPSPPEPAAANESSAHSADDQPAGADCVTLKFGKNLPHIAVTGFPGSGNTWVGHLIQQSTGIYVGSAYCADYMLELGFKGECRHDDTVVVVRTHRMCHHMCCEDEVINVNYSKAIIIIRDPYDALKSEFNRRGGGRTGHAPLELWKTEWPHFIETMASNWKTHLSLWIENFKGPIMILRYEELRKNLRTEIQRLARFLGHHMTDEHLNCVIKNEVGGFKRSKGDVLTYDPFTSEMRKTIDGYIQEGNELIERYWKYRGKYIRRAFCPWE